MTPGNFLWFRAVVPLVGLGVAGVATHQLVRGAVDPGSTATLLAIGLGLAFIAIPWRRDERHDPAWRHHLQQPP